MQLQPCTQGGCKGTTSPRVHIEVLDHNKESGGDHHKCQWNKSNKACESACGPPARRTRRSTWGAAKAEVSQFFAQINNNVMKAAGGGGLHTHNAGSGSFVGTDVLAGQARASNIVNAH